MNPRERRAVPDPAGRLGLGQLQRLASVFDAISDESGARYSAATFVEWLRLDGIPGSGVIDGRGSPAERPTLAASR